MKITPFPEFIDNLWVSIQTLDSIPYSTAEKQIEEFLRAIEIADDPDWSKDEIAAFEIAFYFCTRSVHSRLVYYPKFKAFKAENFLLSMKKLIQSGAKIRTGKKCLSQIVANQTMAGLIAKLE